MKRRPHSSERVMGGDLDLSVVVQLRISTMAKGKSRRAQRFVVEVSLSRANNALARGHIR
jgi:hypothetical protein